MLDKPELLELAQRSDAAPAFVGSRVPAKRLAGHPSTLVSTAHEGPLVHKPTLDCPVGVVQNNHLFAIDLLWDDEHHTHS